MTQDLRDDLYQVVALLVDLDRVLHPLPAAGADFGVEPNPPPPLPPTGVPGAGGIEPDRQAMRSGAGRGMGGDRLREPGARAAPGPWVERRGGASESDPVRAEAGVGPAPIEAAAADPLFGGSASQPARRDAGDRRRSRLTAAADGRSARPTDPMRRRGVLGPDSQFEEAGPASAALEPSAERRVASPASAAEGRPRTAPAQPVRDHRPMAPRAVQDANPSTRAGLSRPARTKANEPRGPAQGRLRRIPPPQAMSLRALDSRDTQAAPTPVEPGRVPAVPAPAMPGGVSARQPGSAPVDASWQPEARGLLRGPDRVSRPVRPERAQGPSTRPAGRPQRNWLPEASKVSQPVPERAAPAARIRPRRTELPPPAPARQPIDIDLRPAARAGGPLSPVPRPDATPPADDPGNAELFAEVDFDPRPRLAFERLGVARRERLGWLGDPRRERIERRLHSRFLDRAGRRL